MPTQPNSDDDAAKKKETISELYQKCREFRQAGDTTQAASILAILSDRYGQQSSLRFKLECSHILKASKKYEEAKKILQELQKTYPRNGHAFRIHSEILVELGKYDEAARLLESNANQFDEQSLKVDSIYRAIKLRTFMADSFEQNISWRPGQHEPVPEAVVIMMIRDEQDIILPNLMHHYHLGFRNFTIINNRSKDKTSEKINAFAEECPDTVVVQILDPVVGYYQREKTRAAVDFSKRYFEAIVERVDWIFVIDADEFLSANEATKGLGSLVGKAHQEGAEIITFNLCNATTSGSETWSEDQGSIYEHFDIVAEGKKEMVLKNAFRSTLAIEMSTGNHVVDYQGLTSSKILPGALAGWRIIHVPYRSVAQVTSKIINGAEALEARQTVNKLIGSHWIRHRHELGERHVENAKTILRRYRETIVRDIGKCSAHFKF
jgi:tetratricopeptide (TPR) repeat protein